MGQFIENVQYRLKTSSASIVLFFFKTITGLMLGLTFALIGQEIIGYGSISFSFTLLAITGIFLKISKKWKWVGVVVFNFVCALLGLLLRMYIQIAPGA